MDNYKLFIALKDLNQNLSTVGLVTSLALIVAAARSWDTGRQLTYWYSIGGISLIPISLALIKQSHLCGEWAERVLYHSFLSYMAEQRAASKK